MEHRSTSDHDDHPEEQVRPQSFWRSRTGIYLIIALVVAALLMGYEHRVHIFDSGWLLWLPLLICVGMHFFMHGGHGGHGRHGRNGSGSDES